MERKEELLKKLESASTMEELNAIKEELRNLQEEEAKKEIKEEVQDEKVTEEPVEEVKEPQDNNEISEEEERKLFRNTDEPDTKEVEVKSVVKGEEKKMNEENKALLEQRGADLKAGKKIVVPVEERTQTISSGTVLVPKKYKNEIEESFDSVSGMIDEMNSIQLNGGESYSVPFEKGFDEGGYTTENGDYTDIDVETDYVETGRAKVTAYTEITKEYAKLPNANYQALVIKRVRDAIRKKIAAQSVVGSGETNTIKGIYNADSKVLTGGADIFIKEIDEDTLNTIIFAYGGNEATEDEQKLILSKKDLEAFSKVKYEDGKFVYSITKKGKTGTISYKEGGASVEYVINSACNSLSAEATADGTKTMIYGALKSYELPIFSDLEIEESKDFKFKKGVIAYRGDVIVGGTVAKYEGFVRIKKGEGQSSI